MMLAQLVTSPRGMPTSVLGGTSWRLAAITRGDGSTETVADPAKYTISFNADGSVSVQLDCNRGHGTWSSPELGKVELGPLAVTRVLCPPGSIGDRVAKDLTHVRSYTIQEGALLLVLSPTADGGSYLLTAGP